MMEAYKNEALRLTATTSFMWKETNDTTLNSAIIH